MGGTQKDNRSARMWRSYAAAACVLASAGGLWAQATRPPASQPAARGARETPSTMPSAAEMIKVLQRDRQVNVPIPPSEPADVPGALPRPIAPPLPQPEDHAALMPEGTFVVDRPGRLVRQGDWWTFVFESADGNVRQPPLWLLPSRQVELMEQTSTDGARSVVFIVSGELTEYHGRNYLLVRKVLVRRNLGNLK